MPKDYLGDGVYADFDGYHVVLTTEDGIRTTNTIYLEDGVYSRLLDYVERLKHQHERTSDDNGHETPETAQHGSDPLA